jgi:tetratricopeptide (TPR) repeat protein
MRTLQKLCALLVLLSLISCDDKAAQPATSTPPTTAANNMGPAQVIEALNERLIANPNDFTALSNLGDVYFQTAQYMEAIQAYDKALAVNPMSADCLNDRGLALYYIGDSQSAIESFDRANLADPGYANAWLSKGWVLISLGRYQEAIEPLNKVKEVDTTGTLSWEADKFLAQIAESEPQ